MLKIDFYFNKLLLPNGEQISQLYIAVWVLSNRIVVMSFFPVESGRLQLSLRTSQRGLLSKTFKPFPMPVPRLPSVNKQMRRFGNENGVTCRLSCACPMRFKRHSSRAMICYSLPSKMCFQSSSKTSVLGKYLSTAQSKPCFTEQTPIQTGKSSVSNSILSRKLSDKRSLQKVSILVVIKLKFTALFSLDYIIHSLHCRQLLSLEV